MKNFIPFCNSRKNFHRRTRWKSPMLFFTTEPLFYEKYFNKFFHLCNFFLKFNLNHLYGFFLFELHRSRCSQGWNFDNKRFRNLAIILLLFSCGNFQRVFSFVVFRYVLLRKNGGKKLMKFSIWINNPVSPSFLRSVNFTQIHVYGWPIIRQQKRQRVASLFVNE